MDWGSTSEVYSASARNVESFIRKTGCFGRTCVGTRASSSLNGTSEPRRFHPLERGLRRTWNQTIPGSWFMPQPSASFWTRRDSSPPGISGSSSRGLTILTACGRRLLELDANVIVVNLDDQYEGILVGPKVTVLNCM